MTQGNDVTADLVHWLLSVTPLVTLLILLVGARWRAQEAGPVGLLVAVGVALFGFQTPWETLAVASAKGVWDAIFILYVIWPGLLLYRVTERAGAFAALRRGIQRFSDGQTFLVLAFSWVFVSFLQGITGFGAPIAIVAPLLVAVGVRPVYAIALPLIGHAWANAFGTLAVAWLATLAVVDLQNEALTALQTALLLWIPNLTAGLGIAWLFGRKAAVLHALPMIGVISMIHGGGQLLLSLWNPILGTLLTSAVAVVALYPLSRWNRYATPTEKVTERPALIESSDGTQVAGDGAVKEESEPAMGLPMALMPYALLIVLTLVALAVAPVERVLSNLEIGFSFPQVDAGLGGSEPAQEPYSPFALFTHPGTFLLVATAAAWTVYRIRGYYRSWERHAKEDRGMAFEVLNDALPASIAVVVFLAMSTVMGHSAQTTVLAQGIARVAPPPVFAATSNFIGVLGAFMTSSNTASNILFGPLQQNIAAAEGLAEPAIIAAHQTGGAIGNSISPANVVLGTGTAGITGQEGSVLRKTLPWALATAVFTGLATLALLLG